MAVTDACRISMVIVVPSLAECQKRYDRVIAAPIARLLGLVAKRVPERVDRPGCVVPQEDANEATPEAAQEDQLWLRWVNSRHCEPRDQDSDDHAQPVVLTHRAGDRVSHHVRA